MSEARKKILAVDMGQASVGLAFYNSAVDVILPLEVLIKKNLQFIFEYLIKIVIEKEVDVVVFGLPEGDYKENSNYNKIKKIGLQFDSEIKSKGLSVEVVFVDEGFTSFLAESKLKEAGLHLKEEKDKVHSIAAANILKRYLGL